MHTNTGNWTHNKNRGEGNSVSLIFMGFWPAMETKGPRDFYKGLSKSYDIVHKMPSVSRKADSVQSMAL